MDNFKHLNDNYGHLIGDKVLQKISSIINQTIRESDYLIRYGGDEFLIILTNCNKENALVNAKNILMKIRNIDKIENYSLNIKISMGIAEGRKNDRLGDIISKADSRLYKAKKSSKSIVT
jgi:diguanylate cyclase (GGDEF)-like protein